MIQLNLLASIPHFYLTQFIVLENLYFFQFLPFFAYCSRLYNNFGTILLRIIYHEDISMVFLVDHNDDSNWNTFLWHSEDDLNAHNY